MGRNGKDHAHIERLAAVLVAFDHRSQSTGANGMLRPTIVHRGHVRLHLVPDVIGNGDRIAVQVHREGRDDMRFGAIADCCRQRLARQHMRAVQLAVDHAVQQHFPVGLRLKPDKKPLVFKVSQLVGHGQRCHIGQLDKAER